MKLSLISALTAFLTLTSASPVIARQETSTSNYTTTYPDQTYIRNVFSNLEGGAQSNDTAFFLYVNPTFNWTIEGTHPAAGVYTNRTILGATFARIAATTSKGLNLTLLNVIGGGEDEWSVQELKVEGVCKSGLVFDNRYAWSTRWATNGTILEARAYLDSALVSEAIQQNEIVTRFTYSDPRDEIVKFVDTPTAEVEGGTGLAINSSG